MGESEVPGFETGVRIAGGASHNILQRERAPSDSKCYNTGRSDRKTHKKKSEYEK